MYQAPISIAERPPRLALVVVAAGLAALLASCGATDAPAGDDGRVPDFSLPDVNATSTTFESQVSPRDHENLVSVWYFGHST